MTTTDKRATLLRILTTALAVCFCTTMMAQDGSTPTKKVTHTEMVAVGSADLLDTYLSPEKYKGSEMRYISHTIRDIPGDRWQQQIIHQGSIAMADDRAEDGNLMGGLYTLDYALQRPLHPGDGQWELRVGGMANFNLGVLYNSRNQNNPAQLKLSMQLGPAAAVTKAFHLFGKEWRARYEVELPLLGLMFCPNYGQSYYEIFTRGDYDHNAVVTTPFNAPSMRHALTIDFPLWKVTWRVGYLGDYQQAEVNNLKQHAYTHALLLGWVKKFKVTRTRK